MGSVPIITHRHYPRYCVRDESTFRTFHIARLSLIESPLILAHSEIVACMRIRLNNVFGRFLILLSDFRSLGAPSAIGQGSKEIDTSLHRTLEWMLGLLGGQTAPTNCGSRHQGSRGCHGAHDTDNSLDRVFLVYGIVEHLVTTRVYRRMMRNRLGGCR